MRTTVVLGLVSTALGDTYMHNPRGSNNRLNEKSANRKNGNRLFDSQNNNRGGYNVGEPSDTTFDPNSVADSSATPGSSFPGGLDDDQYGMMYLESSLLPIEWTAQHGCGGNEKDDPHKVNCNMVIQYMCNNDAAINKMDRMYLNLKDGRNTDTPDEEDTYENLAETNAANDANGYGRHESEAWYHDCERRGRNKGLFTADQNLKGESMKYTRQNPNGNRRGLECPEERDYYPHWYPSPWVDVAVVTDDVDRCAYYKLESQNVADKFYCKAKTPEAETSRELAWKSWGKEDCEKNGQEWASMTHGLSAVNTVDCVAGQWTRVNQLGNAKGAIIPARYPWVVPTLAELPANTHKPANQMYAKCVLRLRYNISTDDYDPWTTNSSQNEDKRNGIVSPVENNPTVDVGANLQGLRLAINTAQFGRTFQTRSHTFYIKSKSSLPVGLRNTKVHNLNVRGKRGNIVQTFPSVEYDFIPKNLTIQNGELLHIQWTGSNTHYNGNPAGDGQAGDAGEGTSGTDRHNMMQCKAAGDNYPLPVDTSTNMFQKCYNPDGAEIAAADCQVYMATSGYYKTAKDATDQNPDALNELLNNAPASLVGGVIVQLESGVHYYMNTRNNNFSNRQQKGRLTVE